MPFETDDGAPLAELLLAQRPADGERFEVRAPFVYVDRETGERLRVPASGEARGDEASWTTDLASVPHALWSLVASYGRQSAPAILHDHRSRLAEDLARTDREAALAQRRADDRRFRQGLREQGVPLLRSWLMWGWVSADREREFGGAAGTVFFVQAIVGALAVLAGFVLAFWNPWWLALAAGALVAALPWGRLAGLQLLLTGTGGVLAPIVVLHLVPLAAFRIVEAIVEIVSGGRPAGVVRPTVARRDR